MFVCRSFLAALVVWGAVAIAEENDYSTHGDAASTSPTEDRQVAGTELREKEIDFIWTAFGFEKDDIAILGRPTQENGQPNPDYLTGALSKVMPPATEPYDETEIAKVMGSMFKWLDDDRVVRLIEQTKAAKKQLETDDPEGKSRLSVLVNRTLWAAKWIGENYLNKRKDLADADKQKANSAKALPFNEKFGEIYKKIQENNIALRTKAAEIADRKPGADRNAEAKAIRATFNQSDFSRANLPEFLTNGIKGSVNSQSFAIDVAKAMWMDEKGEFFADLVSKDGQRQRLNFGNSEPQIRGTIEAMGKTFKGAKLATAKFEDGDVERFTFNAGKLASNKVKAKQEVVVKPKPDENPVVHKKQDPAAWRKLLNKGDVCGDCHGVTVHETSEGLRVSHAKKQSQHYTLRQALNLMDRDGNLGGVSQEDRAKLEAWANAK